jgi:riboflavin biosynthesis pyrimidine reductase
MRQLLPEEREINAPADLESVYEPPESTHLRANFVVSLDGAVELNGRSRALGGAGDRAAFMAMRAVCDAVMVGAGTVRAEHYGPVVLDDEVRRRRTDRGQEDLPRLAVVTRKGDLDPEWSLFRAGQRPILLTTTMAIENHPQLSEASDVFSCGDDEVDIADALSSLAGIGLRRVLCEGGPTLMNALLAADVVDEMCLTFSPVIVGPGNKRLVGEQILPRPADFRLQGLLEDEGFLLARYCRIAAP